MLERVIEASRVGLQTRLDQARTPGEHHAMQEARHQLMQRGPVMCERFPGTLRHALTTEASAEHDKPARSLLTVHFDDLELMDEAQINESIERARARQLLASSVEGPLADLDALMCAAQGLPQVMPESNPLRPDVFLQALQTVVAQMQVSVQVRSDWLGQMAPALGRELRELYLSVISSLKRDGVQPVGYAMRQANGHYVYVPPAHDGSAPGFASEFATDGLPHSLPVPLPLATPADPRLTLDRLRQLLQGKLSDQVAAPLAGELPEHRTPALGDMPAAQATTDTDFAQTVPAAFEALQEMDQVSQFMDQLGRAAPRAQGTATWPPAATSAIGRPHGLGQVLSMEVATLMVDNIARDPRLAWPVQQFIRALEPALMQMALADPRFFSNREHSARRLLQEITERSLAFNGPEDTGFQRFMHTLMDIAGPLASATIESPEDFERPLQELQVVWQQNEQDRKQERLRAIEALEHAERRHLMAAGISREIWLLPQIGNVSHEISRFLLGPWSQVIAEARLTDTTGSADPGHYQELVEALLWSAQPELTQANTGQLARLVPKLLSKLSEGLATIGYPVEKTEALFDLLMRTHQQSFLQGRKPAPATETEENGLPPVEEAALQEEDDPWLAPSEAKESGYLDLQLPAEPNDPLPEPESVPVSIAPDDAALQLLAIGCWVNLLVEGAWERTQLSWIGSRGNLFLFTSGTGRTQTMTLRLVKRLLQKGNMHILTQEAVVDEALDAVARAAMRNSVDSRM